MMSNFPKKQLGFTMIELLVVLSIMAIATSYLLSNRLQNTMIEQRDKIRTKTINEIKYISDAASGYIVDFKKWPDELNLCTDAINVLTTKVGPSPSYLHYIENISPYNTEYKTSCDTNNFNIEVEVGKDAAEYISNNLANTTIKSGKSNVIISSIPRPEAIPYLAAYLARDGSKKMTGDLNMGEKTVKDAADVVLPDGRKLTDLFTILLGITNITENSADITVKTAIARNPSDSVGLVLYADSGNFDKTTSGAMVVYDTSNDNDYSKSLANLDSGIIYRIKAFIIANDGTVNYSDAYTFKTLINFNLTISNVNTDRAMINVLSNAKRENGDTIGFVLYAGSGSFDKTTSGALVVLDNGNDNNYSTTIGGLSYNTTYRVKAFIIDVSDNSNNYSSEKNFTTNALSIDVSISNIGTTSATFNVSSNAIKDNNDQVGIAIYGGSGNFDKNTSGTIVVSDNGSSFNFSTTVNGFVDDTTYRVKAYIYDSSYSLYSYSSEQSFTTIKNESNIGTQWVWTSAGTYYWTAPYTEQLELTIIGSGGGGGGGDRGGSRGGVTYFYNYLSVPGGSGANASRRGGHGSGGGGGGYYAGTSGQGGGGGSAGYFNNNGGNGGNSGPGYGGTGGALIIQNINVTKGTIYKLVAGSGGKGAYGGHGGNGGIRLLKK